MADSTTTRDPHATVRARCRACGYRQRLKADGRVADHPAPGVPWVECGGAGYLPQEAPRG